MKFIDLAKQRSAVRKYTDKKVEKENLDLILEAAHVAPTAGNRQPVRLIVVEDKEGLDIIEKSTNAYQAPLAIIVCADHDKAWTRAFDGKKTTDIDASILTDHMMLQAQELGLGTVWICKFDPEIIREGFKLPDHLEAVNILAIGYPDGKPADPERHSKTRIPLDELILNI